MAHGPIYRVPLRRRRQGKTNYYRRKDMLKSGEFRAVIRRSTKNMRVQIVEANVEGDKTMAYASSMQLSGFNWNLSGSNIPAAYLTGYLAGKRAVKAGIKSAIFDLGLQRNTKGSRIYAALKGVIDAGVEIPVNDEIFPSEEVIHGSHIKTIGENYEDKDFKEKFNKFTKNKVKLDKLSAYFDKAKEAIDKGN